MVKNLPENSGDACLILGSGRSLEEEKATHSSILAWKIPWTEEPGGLQSIGSQRVGHNLVTQLAYCTLNSNTLLSELSQITFQNSQLFRVEICVPIL